MEKIAEAGNVEVPAYLSLLQLGYQLERHYLDSEKQTEIWIAANESLRLSAPSPLELLGLHTMRALRGPEWKAGDEEIDRYLLEFYPLALPRDNEEC